MALLAAELHFGRVRAGLRELTGADELAVARDDTRTAIALLDRLLVPVDDAWPGPGGAALLTSSERDRLLAEVWVETWGRRIVASPRCRSCAVQFDSEFRLDELVDAVWPAPPPVDVTLADGQRLRVPTGADELAVTGLPRAEAIERLVARCVLGGGDVLPDAEEAAAALEAAPVLDLDLDASCPECGEANVLVFRMQSYLLAALSAERARLPAQMHVLARAYGWSVAEILDLPRSTRLQLVRLAEGALAPRRAS